jgi:hypothetical protein
MRESANGSHHDSRCAGARSRDREALLLLSERTVK